MWLCGYVAMWLYGYVAMWLILIKPLIHQRGSSLDNKAINLPIKAINNRSENPEIMKNQEFDVWDNEIEILLYQNEADEIN